jgi:UDP-GlcNAc3NAcA epimerase
MSLKIVTVVGARPQFIKAAALSRAIRNDYVGQVEEVLVHTGQHYDDNMSKIFFEELDIPHPKYNLEISGGQHGAMTGRMLEGIENVLLQEKPDWLLIYGDTNSTLAGALAAAKLHIPIAHVEAGLRSFNMRMPEEINRIVADRISTLLLCPTEAAVSNLKAEGVTRGVHNVGDVMYDVALFLKEKGRSQSQILSSLDLTAGQYVLATCHRAENTDDPARLAEILKGLADVARQMTLVFPLHPRTRKLIGDYGLDEHLSGLLVTEPLPFLDMVALEQSTRLVLTDSGGVQKEAFFYSVPCLTMRDQTEWVETTDSGTNVLVGASQAAISEWFGKLQSGQWKCDHHAQPYGSGDASKKILQTIVKHAVL